MPRCNWATARRNGSVTGNISDNGLLTFDNPSGQSMTGTISGSGGVTKTANGALTLSAANNYGGGTTVTRRHAQLRHGQRLAHRGRGPGQRRPAKPERHHGRHRGGRHLAERLDRRLKRRHLDRQQFQRPERHCRRRPGRASRRTYHDRHRHGRSFRPRTPTAAARPSAAACCNTARPTPCPPPGAVTGQRRPTGLEQHHGRHRGGRHLAERLDHRLKRRHLVCQQSQCPERHGQRQPGRSGRHAAGQERAPAPWSSPATTATRAARASTAACWRSPIPTTWARQPDAGRRHVANHRPSMPWTPARSP